MIYFLFYLFLEVTVTVKVGSYIGGSWMFVEIMLSAFIGMFILRNFKNVFQEHIQALMMRQISMEQFSQRNLLNLLGGFLLIMPGILGDLIGLLMQLSFVQSFFSNRFKKENQSPIQPKDENVIDAEIIDHTNSIR